MNANRMSQLEIRRKGLEALAQALGPVGMVRFLQQFGSNKGDYTKEGAILEYVALVTNSIIVYG